MMHSGFCGIQHVACLVWVRCTCGISGWMCKLLALQFMQGSSWSLSNMLLGLLVALVTWLQSR